MRDRPQGMSRSVDRGTGRLGIEPRNPSFTGSRRCQARRKATTVDVANARHHPPAWSETPDMPGNSMRENRETPAAPAVGEAAGRRENAMSDESFAYAAGESHDCVVPAKAPNKDRTGSAEGLEERRSTKENTRELNPSRTQSRGIGSRGLEGVREAAKRDKGLRFTALLHHVTKGLGFTHICGTVHKTGRFTVRRKTIGKRMAAKLKAIKAELLRRRHEPVKDTGEWLRTVVQGYFNYHAEPGNFARLQSFRHDVIRHWWLAVRRRGQRPVRRAVFDRWVSQYLPTPAILHPYPLERIGAKYPNIQGKNRLR